MGGGFVFLIATLGFVLIGFLASIIVRFSFNKGPSTNLLHSLLVITAVVCAWMMWAIVYLAQWNPLVNPVLSES